MARGVTQDEKQRRLGLVEHAISEHGWSIQLKRKLAAEIGVTTRTIDKYRCEVVEGYRKELDDHELDLQRSEFLCRLRGHQRTALGSGRLGPLAAMMNIETKILGLDRAAVESGPSSVEVVLRVPGFESDDGDS